MDKNGGNSVLFCFGRSKMFLKATNEAQISTSDALTRAIYQMKPRLTKLGEYLWSYSAKIEIGSV
jgi:hypothetical protein